MEFKEFVKSKIDYLDVLGDEFNINPEDIKGTIASFFNIGNRTYSLSPLDIQINNNGDAIVKISGDVTPNLKTKIYQKQDGSYVNYKGNSDTKTYIIPRNQLTALLSQGFKAPGEPV